MRKLWILIGFLLAACGGGGETAVSSPAETIKCTAAYRSSVELGIEREETVTFTGVDDEQSAIFDEMMFHAAYDAAGADNEHSLRVWVTDAADTAVYHATLYQFPTDSGPQNQFVGGHGFTGLHYSYVPDSTAELQFWCAAN